MWTGGAGDRVEFVEIQDGVFQIVAATQDVQVLKGIVSRPKRPVTIEEMSQNGLSELTGIPQSTLSAIENERVNPGVGRAKVLARVLKCHPAFLVFPGWDIDQESAA
jgi:DNA-binding XRE family transcriptional regulator